MRSWKCCEQGFLRERRKISSTPRTGETSAALRAILETGTLIQGLWSLYRAAVLDYGSPLRNLGETLHLEALEQEACVRLATEPMASMGLGYEEGAVARLVERAVLLSLDEFNSWQETLYLLSNPANAAHLRGSIAEAEAGQIVERELIDP